MKDFAKTVRDFGDVLRMGPSFVGKGMINAKDTMDFISDKYFVSWRDSFGDSTDDQMITNGDWMVPGKIYTFVTQKDNLAKRRTVFCVKKGASPEDIFFDYGVEIKSLKPEERARLFSAIFNSFEFTIKENMELIEKNVPEQKPLPIQTEEVAKKVFLLSQISPNVRKFDRRNVLVNTIRCVDYNHWKYLIHCDFA